MRQCGKLEVRSNVPARDSRDLSLAYYPGVAKPCLDTQSYICLLLPDRTQLEGGSIRKGFKKIKDRTRGEGDLPESNRNLKEKILKRQGKGVVR